MKAAELLIELNRLGVKLVANGERLRFTPKEKVTPELLEKLKVSKQELLTILRRKTKVAKINVLDAFEVWEAVIDKVSCDPEFTPEMLEALRNGKPQWIRK